MSGVFLARLILTATAALQGLAPLGIDLNRTHATHPAWPGHARFHVVWQSFASFFLAIPEVALVWWPGPGLRMRFWLAAILTATSMLGFVVAFVSRRLYQGTLHDPGGIPPLRFHACSTLLEIDGNALMVGVGLIALAVAALLFQYGS